VKNRVSVIVPNRNGAETIGLCLEALFGSGHDSFEVIVVDDSSTDHSVAIIEQFPCTLIRLEEHCGAAVARNRGAQKSRGGILFFIDGDCLVHKDTLSNVEKAHAKWGPGVIVGGTYTCVPYDQNFFSMFQSVFIHSCELKNIDQPDYVAAHAMVVSAEVFSSTGGFPENFQPIIEDVEYSHRLRRLGYRLIMEPEILVQHVFHFRSLADSMRNGFCKSKYWTIYSLANRDLMADSGTASLGLKINTLVFCLVAVLAVASFFVSSLLLLYGALVAVGLNIIVNRQLFSLFYRTGGLLFMSGAVIYYMTVYPLAVGTGALAGLFMTLSGARPEVAVES
jgi:glycosyltransferase involved in cell wall biosynthesis